MSIFHRKPILVPIDYSESSLRAARVARAIAAADADVTVLHVAEDFDLTLHPLTWTGGPLPSYNKHRMLNALRTWVNEHDLGAVNLLVCKGDPGTKVCEVAEEMRCNLIVVPSHGRHGVARMMMGSVAERIIRHCHCSVLVLRRTAEEPSNAPITDWVPPQRIVVPVDFSEASFAAIASALEICEGRDGVEVISVAPRNDDVFFYGMEPISRDVQLETYRQNLVRYLTDRGYGSLATQILFGDPGTMIVQHASDVSADLIVMPSKGRHGLQRLLLGSTTERVLRHSSVPLLVLRGDVRESAG